MEDHVTKRNVRGSRGQPRPWGRVYLGARESVESFPKLLACVAWRFWLLSNKGGRGQKNREEIGAPGSTKPPCYAGYGASCKRRNVMSGYHGSKIFLVSTIFLNRDGHLYCLTNHMQRKVINVNFFVFLPYQQTKHNWAIYTKKNKTRLT